MLQRCRASDGSALHGVGLSAAAVGIVSFLVLARNVDSDNDALSIVVRVDIHDAVLVVSLAGAHLVSSKTGRTTPRSGASMTPVAADIAPVHW